MKLQLGIMKAKLRQVFRLFIGAILSAVIFAEQQPLSSLKTTQTGSNGAKVDIDANKVLNPNVHMLEGNNPLPLNKRMTSGPTTIVDPGKSYLSDQPISSNVQNPRQLDLRAVNQPSDTPSAESLMQNLRNGVLPSYTGLSTGNASESIKVDDDSSQIKILKPHFVYHPLKKSRPNRRHRHLNQVGTVSFPFEQIPPESQIPAPPIVVKLNRASRPTPKLQSALEIWQTNRINAFENKYLSASMGPVAKDLMNRDILLHGELSSLADNIGKINNKITELEVFANNQNSKLEPEILAAKKMLSELILPEFTDSEKQKLNINDERI